MAKTINLVLIGRSGCGKGTQAKLLIEHFGNMFYISSGALFRSLAKTDSEAGIKVAQILEEGGLPYDDLATTLWMHVIAFNVKPGQGIVFDGCPRRLAEAKDMDEFLSFLGRKENTLIFLIDISRKEAFNRLAKRKICKKCGQLIPWVGKLKRIKVCNACHGELEARADDTSAAIKNRLDYFEERVVEVIQYFKDQNRLVKINGEQPIEKVFADILQEVKKHLYVSE